MSENTDSKTTRKQLAKYALVICLFWGIGSFGVFDINAVCNAYKYCVGK